MTPANAIRVLLVDDHGLIRAGLRALIERRSRLHIVGEAANNDDLLLFAERAQPHIIVQDLDDERALDLLPELLARVPAARLIVVSEEGREVAHREAVERGVHGLVHKEQNAEPLLNAIEKVHAGELWLPRNLLADVVTFLRRPAKTLLPHERKISLLTVREREVISMLGEGLKNRDIGQQMHISEHTVRHHLTSIFTKLEVEDRLELVIFAYRHGLVPLPR